MGEGSSTTEIHIIDPSCFVIDWQDEGMDYGHSITSICGMREGFITGVEVWRLLSVGSVMEDLNEGLLPEDGRCDICFRDIEGLKLIYLSKI